MTDGLREPELLDATWIPNALMLSQEAGWNQNAADWSVFFTHGSVLGFVAGDRLIATAAALPYGDALGWVSMVLVTAEWRRQGLATRLVADCTAVLRDRRRAALLDAVPGAEGIYAAHGFVSLCEMERWEGLGGGLKAKPAGANLSLDQSAFGADRRFLLDNFLSRPGSAAFASTHGFAILRQGSVASHIGPIVSTPEEAPGLLGEAIRAASGRVFVDALDHDTLVPVLAANGFHLQRKFIRMACGLSELPGCPTKLLAAAGPEFG
ncbi:MAG TPA: GNAT family N-acetyltransferase [Acidobacteriaceae bacterium]|nr:GNAT family N-acetyltransferase [Acidobacteriaceae bacterium]